MFYNSSCEHQQRSITLPSEQSVNGRRSQHRAGPACRIRVLFSGMAVRVMEANGVWWWGQLGKLVAEVAMEAGTACHSGSKPVCAATRLPCTGCELGGEYPEQSGAVTDSFYLMTGALWRCKFVYWICSLCFSLACRCALHVKLGRLKSRTMSIY